MRLYSVAIASLAIGAPTKWTDNLLSQHEIPEVVHQVRGISRGISWNALVRIGLIRALNQDLGCGVRDAVALASALIGGSEPLEGSPFLALSFDRAALEAGLRHRLREALESAPRPRRGRPIRRPGRGGA
jgi:hypothetical protein